MKKQANASILLTMKMKSKTEKEKWKTHARDEHELTLSAYIRKLVENDINKRSPKVDPILLEKEMNEMKVQMNRMLDFLVNLKAPISEDVISAKWSFEYIKDQIITKIRAIIRQGQKQRDLIKEVETIFEREANMLTT